MRMKEREDPRHVCQCCGETLAAHEVVAVELFVADDGSDVTVEFCETCSGTLQIPA